MSVEVLWHSDAIEQLAELWLAAAHDDRALLQAGFDFCEKTLQNRPEEVGETLSETPIGEFVLLHSGDRIPTFDRPYLRMLEYEGAVIVFSTEMESRRAFVWFVCRKRVDISDL